MMQQTVEDGAGNYCVAEHADAKSNEAEMTEALGLTGQSERVKAPAT